MVKHIVMWNLKEEITGEERVKTAKAIKENLEGLVGKVEGLTAASVVIDLLGGSNRDVALFCELESEEALNAYQAHPEHQHVANTYVRPFTCDRVCADFEC